MDQEERYYFINMVVMIVCTLVLIATTFFGIGDTLKSEHFQNDQTVIRNMDGFNR